MLPGDSEAIAREKAVIFDDPRVHQFWDPNQLSGKAVAEALGYKGRIAWDIYLFYPPGCQWQKHPPQPADWMHQISAGWADRGHFYTGEELGRKLYETAQGLMVPKE